MVLHCTVAACVECISVLSRERHTVLLLVTQRTHWLSSKW